MVDIEKFHQVTVDLGDELGALEDETSDELDEGSAEADFFVGVVGCKNAAAADDDELATVFLMGQRNEFVGAFFGRLAAEIAPGEMIYFSLVERGIQTIGLEVAKDDAG